MLNKLLILVSLVLVSCSTTKPVRTWRNAYLNRKLVTVSGGVPFYAEHIEYLKREVNYMCLSGIKPMLPKTFTNAQALDFCGCMSDKYQTDDEVKQIMLNLDYNPNEVVKYIKGVQNEYWAVMDDEAKQNYREIAKYPPNYYEKIVADHANCLDDVNYKLYNAK